MGNVVVRRADGDSVLEERRANRYKGFVSLDSPTYGRASVQVAEDQAMSKQPAQRPQSVPVAGSRNEKYVLVDGKYRLNPKYDPPFDITLGQAIAIPPLLGAGAALLPEIAAAAASAGRFIRYGDEIKIGKNFKIAPFGNRTDHPTGKWPHYHRRPSANPPPGQSLERHRPWDKNERYDKGRWDRF